MQFLLRRRSVDASVFRSGWAHLLLGLMMLGPSAAAQEAEEVRIPMRDGVRLATDLYFPASTSQPHPVILIRTPYNKELAEDYGEHLAGWDYVVAIQDVRGRFASEGDWEPFVHEGTGV